MVPCCPQVCLPICDMTPGSCPCDHVCLPRPIELRQGDSTEIYLCGPPDAGESKAPPCLRVCRYFSSLSGGEAQAIEFAIVVAERVQPMTDHCNRSVGRHLELTKLMFTGQLPFALSYHKCPCLLRFKSVHLLPYLGLGYRKILFDAYFG